MTAKPSKCFLQLVGINTEGSRWVIPITDSPFSVGRNTECNLRLTVEGISRFHAEILEQEGQWWVRDNASTNGTFLNRRRITEVLPIKSGDVLQFADLQFAVADLPAPGTQRTSIINPHAEQFERMMKESAVSPYYQPIIRFTDGTIVAYELLGRVHYEGLPESPAAIFQIARKLDRDVELSQLFRERSFSVASQMGLEKTLFFNMLPAEMDVDSIHATFLRVRQQYPSIRLVMELHESVVTQVGMIKKLRQVLKELGILLSYDDFGSGQARLLELMEAPPDIIKFDISLIRDIHLRPAASQAILAALVKMSRDIGVHTLAEGVEAQEEAEVCRQMGFDLAQGFHFGRPEPMV